MAEKEQILKKNLLKAISRMEHFFSEGKFDLKDRLNLLEPIRIVPFYGFGSERYVFLKGRVLEKEKMHETPNGESTWQHLKDTYKRYESDEIPEIALEAGFAGKKIKTRTDSEGYFELEFRFDDPVDYEKEGKKVQIRLLEKKTDNDSLTAEGKIFVPGRDVEFGVISDIDDTILISRATDFLASWRLKLMQDAAERHPFPGIAAFLKALQKGADGKTGNPIFFVSGSPWNLFDLLVNFFRYHNIPLGPLLLRDKGTRLDRGKMETSQREYKQEKIRHILETYPGMKFICIGDSGQHDPESYRKIQQEYPGRLLGIYIRDVSGTKRERELQETIKKADHDGAEILLVEETFSAARHALSRGWINKQELDDIRESCKRDSEEY